MATESTQEAALERPALEVRPQPRAQGLMNAEAQRAVAEVQAALLIARANPRDPMEARDRIMMDCARLSLAQRAVYAYARGGSDISGPSIRLAEVLAQRWGNISYGVRELEQRQGESVIQAYAWDTETNTRREMTFTVKHRRDTKKGTVHLEDARDIYELTANQGARRVRACILGVIPGDLVEDAVHECELTLQRKAAVTPERMAAMLELFKGYGVTKAQIEARIQRHLEAITPALFVQLGKIANSLKDGISSPADWFDAEVQAEPAAQAPAGAAGLKAKLQGRRKGRQPATAPPAASSPVTDPAPPSVPAAEPPAEDRDLVAEAKAMDRELFGDPGGER